MHKSMRESIFAVRRASSANVRAGEKSQKSLRARAAAAGGGGSVHVFGPRAYIHTLAIYNGIAATLLHSASANRVGLPMTQRMDFRGSAPRSTGAVPSARPYAAPAAVLARLWLFYGPMVVGIGRAPESACV